MASLTGFSLLECIFVIISCRIAKSQKTTTNRCAFLADIDWWTIKQTYTQDRSSSRKKNPSGFAWFPHEIEHHQSRINSQSKTNCGSIKSQVLSMHRRCSRWIPISAAPVTLQQPFAPPTRRVNNITPAAIRYSGNVSIKRKFQRATHHTRKNRHAFQFH